MQRVPRMNQDQKRKIDPTLFDLCLGIFCYGVLFEAILLIFSRQLSYSLGLWLGVVLAMAGSVHMWWVLTRSLGSEKASRNVGAQSILRYFVLFIMMLLGGLTGLANPIFVFFGYMGMKFAAYVQPFTHRVSVRLFGTALDLSD